MDVNSSQNQIIRAGSFSKGKKQEKFPAVTKESLSRELRMENVNAYNSNLP